MPVNVFFNIIPDTEGNSSIIYDAIGFAIFNNDIRIENYKKVLTIPTTTS
jgi:hypothetical protein